MGGGTGRPTEAGARTIEGARQISCRHLQLQPGLSSTNIELVLVYPVIMFSGTQRVLYVIRSSRSGLGSKRYSARSDRAALPRR